MSEYCMDIGPVRGLVEQLVARFYRDLDDRIEQIWADIGHWVGYL